MDNSVNKQSVTVTDRRLAELTGISSVESYDDGGIVCTSSLGGISVEGEDLKIDAFSVETGKLTVTGTVNGIFYFSNKSDGKLGIFGKRKK